MLCKVLSRKHGLLSLSIRDHLMTIMLSVFTMVTSLALEHLPQCLLKNMLSYSPNHLRTKNFKRLNKIQQSHLCIWWDIVYHIICIDITMNKIWAVASEPYELLVHRDIFPEADLCLANIGQDYRWPRILAASSSIIALRYSQWNIAGHQRLLRFADLHWYVVLLMLCSNKIDLETWHGSVV